MGWPGGAPNSRNLQPLRDIVFGGEQAPAILPLCSPGTASAPPGPCQEQALAGVATSQDPAFCLPPTPKRRRRLADTGPNQQRLQVCEAGGHQDGDHGALGAESECPRE